MRIISVLMYVMFFIHSFSQAKINTIDSLLKKVQANTSVSGADTALINTFNELAEQFYKQRNYLEALQYANKVIQIPSYSDKQFLLGQKLAKVKAYNIIGKVYSGQNSYYKAIDIHWKAISICNEIQKEHRNNLKAKIYNATAYNGIGGNYYFLGILDKAIEAYFRSLKIYEEIHDVKRIGALHNNIGLIYEEKRDNQGALSCYLKGLAFAEKAEDKRGMASSYSNVSNIYAGKGDAELIKNELQKAFALYDTSLFYSFKALRINREAGNENWMAFNYSNIGTAYEKKGSLDTALSYYFKAFNIRKKIDENRGLALSAGNIGQILIQQNKIASAKKHFLFSLKIAKKYDLRPQIIDTYLALSKCEKQKGNFKEAHRYHELYSLLKDSVLNEKSTEQIAEMQAKYETEKKEKENQLLQKENRIKELNLSSEMEKNAKQRIFFTGTGVSALLLAGYIFNRRRLKQKLQLKVKLQKERERISRDLHDNIGSQLSYIISNLNYTIDQNSISGKEKDRLISVEKETKNTIQNLRDTIWAIHNESISLEEFAERLKKYAEQQLEFREQPLLEFNYTGSNIILTPVRALNLFRISQEAINNSIKHSEAGCMKINIDRSNLSFKIEIMDDGKGFKLNSEHSGNHYGLENMKTRAEEIQARFSIHSLPGQGTNISISFS